MKRKNHKARFVDVVQLITVDKIETANKLLEGNWILVDTRKVNREMYFIMGRVGTESAE